MLEKNPELPMHSTQDTKCKALFSALGILDDFTRDKTPNTSILAVDVHPTHWIFGCCHSGNSDEKENGYNVVCLPKMSCSREEFCEFVDEMVAKIGGPSTVKRMIYRPDDWRTHN